jgi:hypothetical protein
MQTAAFADSGRHIIFIAHNSHLLLLYQGFRLNRCSRRWFQLTGMGTSVKDVQDDFHVTDVSNDYWGIENCGEVKVDVAANREPSNLQITADTGKACSTKSYKRGYKRLGAGSFSDVANICPDVC